MALTQISTQGIKDGTITGSDLATNVDLVDNQKLRLGNSNDLQIYHDGSNSYIQDLGTGQLRFLSNDYVFYNAGGNENIARFIENDSVELYYDNSKKFETYANGIKLGDNVLAAFGDDIDLLIHHTGSTGYIKNQTGNFYIQNDGVIIIGNQSASTTGLKFSDGGAIELYHDNSKKFETTSTGITLSGTAHLVSSGNFYPANDNNVQLGLSNRKWSSINGVSLNINGGDAEFRGTTPGTTDMTWDQSENALNFDDNVYAHFGNSDDLQIYHTGSHSLIKNNTGYLQLVTDSFAVNNNANSENIISALANGAVNLFYDDSKKFETTSWGSQVTGTLKTSGGGLSILSDGEKFTAGAGDDLQIYHDGSNSYIEDAGTGALLIKSNTLYLTGTNAANDLASFVEGGAVSLYFDDVKKFETTSAGVLVSAGHLDISDNQFIRLGASADLQIYHNGTHSYIDETQNGNLVLRTNPSGTYAALVLQAGQENSVICHKNGNVELYYDNSKKFETTSSGGTICTTIARSYKSR